MQSIQAKSSLTNKIPFLCDKTYIITGGLGYIGLEIAKCLVNLGCRNIVLVSKRQAALPVSWTLTTRPSVVKCDITNRDQVTSLLILKYHRNLGGVIHSAGILRDATIENLTTESFDAVYAPKVQGVQNILSLCKDYSVKLDMVVMFSSIAACFGAPGQANYAAANGALNTIALECIRNGTSAWSIQWGPWSGAEWHQEKPQNAVNGLALGLSTTRCNRFIF